MIILKDSKKDITSPMDLTKLLQSWLLTMDKVDQDKEHFFNILLNTRNVVKMVEIVSIGTINASIVHPREVFTRAVGERCAHIIIAHNHPSESTQPSEADLLVTKNLVKAGKILDIEVLDHVIFNLKGEFTSLKEKGLM